MNNETLKIKILDEDTIKNKRIIIIGDIHGCYDELLCLLQKIDYDRSSDILISVGDILMKGPNSVDVLNFFIYNKNTFCVLGNHEHTILNYYNMKKLTELDSEHKTFSKNMNNDQIYFLNNLPHIIKIPKYDLIIVHAGINPFIDINNNNPFDVIHIRNILDNGVATEFITNGNKWIDFWNGKETIIFGHDARRGLQQTSNAIGLDTACVYGGSLTCIIYPGKKIISVDAFKK